MRLLDQLKEFMGEIERKDDYAFKFIEKMTIRSEENPDFGLKNMSKPQVKYLLGLHTKYCGGR